MPLVSYPKPKRKMPILTKFAIGVGALVGLGMMAFIIYWALVIYSLSMIAGGIDQSNKDSKMKLAPELTRFQPVQGCSVPVKTESPEGSEGGYYVDLEYKCPVQPWGTLEGQILHEVTDLGYPLDKTSKDDGEPLTYSADGNALVVYRNACCNVTVTPSFVNARFETSDVNAFKSEPVNGYTLDFGVNPPPPSE